MVDDNQEMFIIQDERTPENREENISDTQKTLN